jgi:UDP-N-acetylglucosamine 2-epimerase (non-hydrolysing)
VIDALQLALEKLQADQAAAADFPIRFPFCDQAGRHMLLVTGHRRESFGDGVDAICRALATLARRPDIHIVYPVHPNPHVRNPVRKLLGGLDRVSLIDPLDYPDFVAMMSRAHVILTDSGGVQEEAPSFGKPVLVMRDVTERGEAVTAGTVQLVGTDEGRIVAAVARLFDDAGAYRSAAGAINPYGDGHAAARIVDALMGRPVAEFDTGIA